MSWWVCEGQKQSATKKLVSELELPVKVPWTLDSQADSNDSDALWTCRNHCTLCVECAIWVKPVLRSCRMGGSIDMLCTRPVIWIVTSVWSWNCHRGKLKSQGFDPGVGTELVHSHQWHPQRPRCQKSSAIQMVYTNHISYRHCMACIIVERLVAASCNCKRQRGDAWLLWGQARRLWRRVEDSEQLVNELQAHPWSFQWKCVERY